TLSGSVDTFHTGPEGADLRRFLKYTEEKERREYWENRMARDLPGVTLTDLQSVQPATFDKPIEFHLKLTAAQYAHVAGPLLLVRPRVVGTDAERIDDKQRTVPIDLGASGKWHDSYTIALPAGWTVDETPDPTDIDTDFASYHSKFTASGGELRYEREYVVREVEIPAARVAEFRKLETAILADEKGTAVLKKQ
ncbi:MAG: hypothetical protein WCE75_12300, partial [Terracidiphilus sp.]